MVETRARKRQRLNKDEYFDCKKIKIEEISCNIKKKNEEKQKCQGRHNRHGGPRETLRGW